MKFLVYPAVLEKDETQSTYCFNFPDLNIVSPGVSIERAYLKACSDFQAYISFSEKFDFPIADPTPFENLVKSNPKKHVMLFRAKISGEVVSLSNDELAYKRLVESMFEWGV